MRLFWKVFLLLLVTLTVTAIFSSWMSRQWLAEDRAIEAKIEQLSTIGSTAAAIFHDGGQEAYRQWRRHNLRGLHVHGSLLDGSGNPLASRRPLPPELRPLLEDALKSGSMATLIQPPILAVALPIHYRDADYYWSAFMRLPPEQMSSGLRQAQLVRIAVVVVALALISWLLTRMITRPITSLRRTTERLGTGALDTRCETELTARADELGELATTVDAMAERVEALLNSHKQLLRDISHELRSPLARLQVALELARQSDGNSLQGELDRIDKEAAELNELIGQVLTLARFEQGAVTLQAEPLNLDKLLAQICEDAAFEAEAVEKSVQFDALQHCSLSGDPLWLGRAIENVIRNAVRHTEAGNSVEVALNCESETAVISVRDHGPGVDESLLKQLFEPFVRGSDARERHSGGGGYGLGLAIASDAIEMHRGKIQAENHPDGGLLVTITLPVT